MDALPSGPSSTEGRKADQTELLESRYELVHLVFQFLISFAVLVGVFYVVVITQDVAAASGGVALATLIVLYWLGLTKTKPL
jgi:hypothetical protein